jgi:hypothetical protein
LALSVPNAIGGAEQNGGADRPRIEDATIERGVECPQFERQGVLRAAQQRGVAMRVGIDKAGDQPASVAENVLRGAAAKLCAVVIGPGHRCDVAALDQHGAGAETVLAQDQRAVDHGACTMLCSRPAATNPAPLMHGWW